MAQLTLYLPDDVERELRREAKRANKSLSAYMVSLARPKLQRAAWPKSFTATFGSWRGTFPKIDELPFERRDEL
ncbi:MAG: hypothetical protein JNG84_13455 [Archangium sp.]|nr:hypothetical protein [Archangium sp.]